MGVLIGDHCFCCEHVLEKFGMDYILSIISVFLFAGLTAWDNQKIHVYDQTNGQPARLGSSDGFGTLSDLYQPLYQPSSYLRKKRLIKERLGVLGFFLSFRLVLY